MINIKIEWHIFLSTLALVVMCIAGLQAMALIIQDYYIRRFKIPLLVFLPSVETMEKYLFRTIILGWILLSAVFVSSLIFFKHIFVFPLYEKTLLTLVAWCIFTLLLMGRYIRGWRGKTAIRWTFSGIILLFLIYCGTGIWFHVSS